jgi:DNA end-binding protein Ku
MAARSSWKGTLKFGLIPVAVKLYNSTTTTEGLKLNGLDRITKQKINQLKVVSVAKDSKGAIEKGDGTFIRIVDEQSLCKGYEISKGEFVILEKSDLEAVSPESDKVINLQSFVDPAAIPSQLRRTGYFVTPDGKPAQEAFAVLREGMKKSGKVGVGKVTMRGHEHTIVVEPYEEGLTATTLYFEHEVRGADTFFGDIADTELPDAAIDMATNLIGSMDDEFDPSDTKDAYQDRLMEVIMARKDGKTIAATAAPKFDAVVSLMDSLQASMDAKPKKKTRAKQPA